MKNILFVHEVASQAEILSKAILKSNLWFNIKRILYFNHKYYKQAEKEDNILISANLDIDLYKKSFFWRLIISWRLIIFLIQNINIILKADIIHFFSWSSFLPLNIDLFFLKKIFKKKIIMEYNGSEIRQPNFSNKINIFYKLSEWCHYFSDSIVKKRLKRNIKYCDKIILPYPELFLQANNILWKSNKLIILPHIIDYQFLKNIDKQKNIWDKIKILHAPSNLNTKWTMYIREIIKLLKLKYNFIDYKEITNKKREDIFKEFKNTDIVIDQMLIWDFWIFALEAMSAWVITISYLLDQVEKSYPKNLPIINANLFTLYSKIEKLILDKNQINIIGKKSQEYVFDNHSEDVIFKKYKELLDSI